MNGIYYYVIAFLLIWTIAIVFKGRLENYGLEVNFPLLMWKTQRLRGFIDRIANRAPRFWKWYMNIGIVISTGFMILMAVALVYSLKTLMDAPTVSLVIPGVEVPGSPIFIPFLSGLIALATVLIVHEFSHGILARVEKIKINSIGLLLFAILPGAFVEPDEEELKGLNRPSRMRIYVAGSMANLTLAAIALVIMMLISSFVVPAVFEDDGIVISRLTEDGNAINYLSEGMVIKGINNYSVSDGASYQKAVSTLRPNQTVTVLTDQGEYSFQLKSNPQNKSLGYMGVQAQVNQIISPDFDNKFYTPLLWGIMSLTDLLFWIYFLNFAVGTFNLLPMKPLDGGHLFEDLLSYITSENIYKPVVTFMSFFMGIIIVVSLVVGFVGVPF
ncbi:peptidase M50 family [Methanobrevibacter ruminantium M1]|uniref:Peptidase M50 family n=1 Tax=Methanobrevibacter ruminantium (strain ATCC 35063 / DSM 1093 / JCM 13430 / OCM 146 / M1) TaxID=634498 RepID=D3DYR2_METRM|nr:site-2 protease family protein [Methanobrevibacter ruminantium]ADC45982.1 peptidase M50 family [Methanobrevibacter ruminantium M1]